MIKKIISLILTVTLLSVYSLVTLADTAPEIVKITPDDESTEIEPVGMISEVTFSCDMDMKTLNMATVTLEPSGIVNIVPVGTKKIRIYYDKLQLGKKHTLMFNSAIKSADGLNLAQTKKFFTTKPDYPTYRQLINSDMENEYQQGVYTDAGAKSVKFVKEGTNTVLSNRMAWTNARIIQKAYVESGKRYEARARVKSSIEQQVWFNLSYNTVSNPSAWYHASNKVTLSANAWTDLTAQFTVPDEALADTWGSIEICAATMGSTVYVDDWQFFEEGCDVEAPESTIGADTVKRITTAQEHPDGDKNAQKLAAFGIYSGNKYKNETANVSREDFCECIAAFMGNHDVNMAEHSGEFSDIDPSVYEGYAGVAAFYDMLKPVKDGSFSPNATVSAEEAVRATVIALGYRMRLQYETPFECASKLKILSSLKLSPNEKIDYKNLSILLANALEAKVATTNVQEVFVSEKTAREEYLGITEHQGIIDGTDASLLWSAQSLKADMISLNGQYFRTEGFDVAELLGKRVKIYSVEADGDSFVLYISDADRLNKTTVLDAYDIDNFKNNTYSYTSENGKSRTLRISADRYFIYNGKSLTDYSQNDFTPVYGSVTLNDNNCDGIYDVISVTDYQTVVVEAFDAENGIIHDRYSDEGITINPDGDIRVFENGVKRKYESISTGDVLTVAKSRNGESALIYKSSANVSGEVKSFGTENGVTFFEFYDEVHGSDITQKFNLIKGCNGCKDVKMGASGKALLDFKGNVAAFIKDSGELETGYICAVGIENSLSAPLKLKIFTEDNSIEFFKAAARLSVDGAVYTDSKTAYNYLLAGSRVFEGTVALYKTNTVGEITKIITPQNSEVNSLRKIDTGTDAQYCALGTIANRIALKDSTKTFIVPESADDDSDYMYDIRIGKEYFLAEKGYSYTAYSVGENECSADIVLLKNRPVRNPDGGYIGVVEKITYCKNDDGDDIIKIVANNTNGTVKLSIDDEIDINNLTAPNGEKNMLVKVGDVITWQYRTKDNYTTNLSIIFKAEDKKMLTDSNPTASGVNIKNRAIYGELVKKESGLIKLKTSENINEVYDTQLFKKIYAYENGKLVKILGSEMSRYANQSVFVVSSWGDATLMVVY